MIKLAGNIQNLSCFASFIFRGGVNTASTEKYTTDTTRACECALMPRMMRPNK